MLPPDKWLIFFTVNHCRVQVLLPIAICLSGYLLPLEGFEYRAKQNTHAIFSIHAF